MQILRQADSAALAGRALEASPVQQRVAAAEVYLNRPAISGLIRVIEPEKKMNDSSPQTRGIAEEIRVFGRAIPHKALFAILLLAWIGLFHFLGNPNLGYAGLTSSLFNWLRIVYNSNPDETLGPYIPLVIIALIWWKREELSAVEKHVWWPALAGFALAALLHIAGYTIQQARVSIVAFVIGLYSLTGLLWGYRWMRATFFPVFLFAFAVPLTTDMEGLTLPLRQLATTITVMASRVLGINVIQEGTLMFDAAHRFQYNVEAACSGLRSLTTMLALGCIFAFTCFQQNWKRGLLILSAVPFAVIGNALRLLTIVIAAESAGQAAGNYVHKHPLFSLIPYVPAMVGMSLMARWLRKDPRK